jgi:hypothetical protein
MELTRADIDKIYFLTRTSLSSQRILNLAKNSYDFDFLLSGIVSLKSVNLDRDWALFDYNYIDNKTIYAANTKIIEEKDIFKGTYIHQCRNGKKYLIQIIGKSGYCRKCDTQFFPRLWWDHALKEEISYNEIKYGKDIKNPEISLSADYLNMLLNLNVDLRILNESLEVIHSPLEIEKILNTKYFDWNNPPPLSRIHAKLMLLRNVWKIKPIKKFGMHSDNRYFFHKCRNNTERILFQEKNFYSWCPNCFTKFIPEWDAEAVKLYSGHITVKTYVSNEFKEHADNQKKKDALLKRSNEYFYLALLGLKERCAPEKILDTFRKLSKIYHPDYGGESDTFQKIVKAKNWLIKFYKTLSKIP